MKVRITVRSLECYGLEMNKEYEIVSSNDSGTIHYTPNLKHNPTVKPPQSCSLAAVLLGEYEIV